MWAIKIWAKRVNDQMGKGPYEMWPNGYWPTFNIPKYSMAKFYVGQLGVGQVCVGQARFWPTTVLGQLLTIFTEALPAAGSSLNNIYLI